MEYRYQLEEKKPCLNKSKSGADQLKPSEFEILKNYTGENTHYEIDESMENFIWGDK